ncbi:MAG TPA: SHOCT domain-containing protein [Ktedonobacterales bacterium]
MVMRRRVGRPLLRTAVVGGAAYAAGHSAARKSAQEADQNQRLAELEQQAAYQEQAPYPPQAPMPGPSAATGQAGAASASPDRIAQLKTLGDLHASGVLTDQEFETEKRRILQQS